MLFWQLGALPIMADNPEESDTITAHAKALVLNIGQLSPRKLEAMLRSGKRASHLGIPIILDPVGGREFPRSAQIQIQLVRGVCRFLFTMQPVQKLPVFTDFPLLPAESTAMRHFLWQIVRRLLLRLPTAFRVPLR